MNAAEAQVTRDLADAPATTTPAATPAATSATAACPRCQVPLIDPDGLGWCKQCGYCRSLESEKTNRLLQAQVVPARPAVMATVAGSLPIWFWVLVVGVGLLAAASVAVGKILPEGVCKPRALWTTGQIAVGLFLILAGQSVALIRIAPEDEKLSFKDALMPTRLWVLVGKRLPRLHGCLWTSVWGLALVAFAIIFIGGLSHWMTYLPGAKNGPSTSAKTSR